MLKSNGSTCLVSVDGTDCRIQEPRPFNRKWYSVKFKGPGLRYEISLCIQTGDIASVMGPYPCGSFRDDKVFLDGLVHHLLPTEKVIADRGYRMIGTWCECPDKFSGYVEFERMKDVVRSRHETVNSRLKQYSVLSTHFRSNTSEHWYHFHAIANIVQISLKNGHPLFQVVYDDKNYL
jgi:uncharacterized protein YggL (DUF469 family)